MFSRQDNLRPCGCRPADPHRKDCPTKTAKPVKQIDLNLEGLDSNAYALMGAFKRQAKKEGWTLEEINAVLNECVKGDYDHLLQTLMAHCE